MLECKVRMTEVGHHSVSDLDVVSERRQKQCPVTSLTPLATSMEGSIFECKVRMTEVRHHSVSDLDNVEKVSERVRERSRRQTQRVCPVCTVTPCDFIGIC
jgi:hypothetical protein